MFARTRSLDEIVDRAYALLLQSVGTRLKTMRSGHSPQGLRGLSLDPTESQAAPNGTAGQAVIGCDLPCMSRFGFEQPCLFRWVKDPPQAVLLQSDVPHIAYDLVV